MLNQPITKNDKRSRQFTHFEWDMLKEYRYGFTSSEAAANKLGITRNALDVIIGKGSCHPNTYKILSRKIFKKA